MLEIIGKRTLPSELLWLSDDGCIVYTLLSKKGVYQLVAFDIDSFSIVGMKNISYLPSAFLSPVCDENCIYLPTRQGQLIGLDKFSFEQLVIIELGNMSIIADPQLSGQHTISVCSLPIAGLFKTHMDQHCIAINNTETGRKVAQTQILKGSITNVCTNDYIWIGNNSDACGFSYTGELILKKELPFSIDFSPLILSKRLLFACSRGLLAELDYQLNIKNTISVGSMQFKPITDGKCLYIYADGLLRIIQNNWSIIDVNVVELSLQPVLYKNHLISASNNKLVAVDTVKHQTDALDLSDDIKMIRIVQNTIIAVTAKEIYTCRIVS